MRHLCKNFIEDGICDKCWKPEWAVYFPEFKHKIGSKVRLPQDHPDGGEQFFVVDHDKMGYILGREKGVPLLKGYSWWELYPIKSQEED